MIKTVAAKTMTIYSDFVPYCVLQYQTNFSLIYKSPPSLSLSSLLVKKREREGGLLYVADAKVSNNFIKYLFRNS